MAVRVFLVRPRIRVRLAVGAALHRHLLQGRRPLFDRSTDRQGVLSSEVVDLSLSPRYVRLKPRLDAQESVEAERSSACRRQIQTAEAEHDRQLSFVEQREEAAREGCDEIATYHL